jgi:hypothetical protein
MLFMNSQHPPDTYIAFWKTPRSCAGVTVSEETVRSHSALKMEAAGASETLPSAYQGTQYLYSENQNLNRSSTAKNK